MTTRDGGRTWRRAPEVTTPTRPGPGLLLGRLAAAPWADEFELSADGGRSWRPLRLPPLDDDPPGAGRFLRFAFADAADGWLLDAVVGSSGVPFATRAALWRTTDGGGAWTRLPAPDVPDPDPEGVGVGVPAEAMGFVDANRGVLAVVSGHTTAVLVATGDGGATWSRVAALGADGSPPPPLSIAVLAAGGPGLLAVVQAFASPSLPGARGSARVYTAASADGGRTWTPPRPGPQIHLDGVPSVAGGDRLLMLDGRALWTSSDGGATWSVRTAVVPGDMEPVGPVSGDRRTLFVLATRSGGVGLELLRSSDGGGHWGPVQLPRVLPPAAPPGARA